MFSQLIHVDDGAQMKFQVGTASAYIAGTNYKRMQMLITGEPDATYLAAGHAGTSGFTVPGVSAGNVGGEGTSGYLVLMAASTDTVYPSGQGVFATIDANGESKGGAVYFNMTSTNIITRVKLTPDANTITSGRMTVWGLAHA